MPLHTRRIHDGESGGLRFLLCCRYMSRFVHLICTYTTKASGKLVLLAVYMRWIWHRAVQLRNTLQLAQREIVSKKQTYMNRMKKI